MNIMILFNGKEYFKDPLPVGGNPDTILDNRPGCMFLDHANSQEEADMIIQRDRDRHKPSWI